LGRLHLKKGKLDECISSLRTAVRYDAADFKARLHLGIAFLNKMELDAAEKELVEAAFLNTQAVTPHYYLGILFIEKKNYDIAQKAFEKAKELKREKDYPLLHRYLGGIYEVKKLRKQAVEELETYLRLQPQAKDAERIRRTIADLKADQS
jgi:tetratricopeptide (TPR) repeat protein